MRQRRESRASIAQRRYARIEREDQLMATAQAKKHGATIDSSTVARAVSEERCPFEMVRAINAATKES